MPKQAMLLTLHNMVFNLSTGGWKKPLFTKPELKFPGKKI